MLISPTASSPSESRPIDTAAVAGNIVTFNCASSSNRRVHWDYYKLGSVQVEHVWDERQTHERFVVDAARCRSESRCDVSIANVSLADAGSFHCYESGSNNQFSASLTVLGKQLIFHQLCTLLIYGKLQWIHSTGINFWSTDLHTRVEWVNDRGETADKTRCRAVRRCIAAWTRAPALAEV